MYALNSILELLNLESVEIVPPENSFEKPDALLEELVAYALQEKRIEEWEQERLCDQVMGLLSLRPSEVQKEFDKRYAVGAKEATDWFYGYCVYNYYVKRARLDKNPRFDVNGLTVTINKSKPEFRDPNKAKAGNSVKGGYPKCVICRENEGYAPRDKRTLRAVSMTLGGENFFWQYSPYGYFHEHGIAVNCTHTPMYVDKSTFYKLMDFVDLFPHYFIGCNAPLPRIGGSVLAHDHYQGGGEILPLHKAKIKTYLQMEGYDSVKIGILDWPGTVLRIVGEDRDAIAEVGDKPVGDVAGFLVEEFAVGSDFLFGNFGFPLPWAGDICEPIFFGAAFLHRESRDLICEKWEESQFIHQFFKLNSTGDCW